MENQCIGLAEALGVDYELKRLFARRPWTALPPAWWWRPLRESVCGIDLRPPWPDLVISCGRRSVATALAIKRVGEGRVFALHIQHPRISPDRFDLLIVPRHDKLSGANIIQTDGALHRVTQERLVEAARVFAPHYADLPRPLVTVLLGGSNRRQALSAAVAERLAERLLQLSVEDGVGLAITPSRRTTPAVVDLLRRKLAQRPVRIWDGGGDNPYFGLLALADAIVVTEDSVSMVTEACSTGKPVQVFEYGGGGGRHQAFHRRMRELGCTRPFQGRFEHWSYQPLRETARVAERVQALW